MEIQRITDAKSIISILKIEDNHIQKQLLTPRNCTMLEWVQFLQSSIVNERMIGIWGIIEDNNLINYIVAMNAVFPPIGKEILLVYQNFFGSIDEKGNHLGTLALEKVKEWGKLLGAEAIHTFTLYPRVMTRFGFVEEKGSSVYLKL
jgi:hypothetical protein